MQHPVHCYDRLPLNVNHAPNGGAQRIALLKSNIWPNGSKIGIKFSTRTGTRDNRMKVMDTAHELMEFANLDFAEQTRGPGEIRISFDPRGGAWSYIGTDALRQPTNKATMNLGFDQHGTYRHEFGHAIGAVHEHQNPHGGINWNREQVIRDLSGPPNNWDLETIERNMFAQYSGDQLNGSKFDADSVMLYAIPSSWTTDGFSSRPNENWSQKDIEWIHRKYPRSGGGGGRENPSRIELIDLTPQVHDDIRTPGETDLFDFVIADSRQIRVETIGSTSLVVRLFGPDNRTNLIAQTDNAGAPLGTRIDRFLSGGRYFIQVSHVEPSGVGLYQLRCMALTEKDALLAKAGELVIEATCPIDPGTYSLERK